VPYRSQKNWNDSICENESYPFEERAKVLHNVEILLWWEGNEKYWPFPVEGTVEKKKKQR